MVTLLAYAEGLSLRWWGYVVLSLLVNIALVLATSWSKPAFEAKALPVLKLNLMSQNTAPPTAAKHTDMSQDLPQVEIGMTTAAANPAERLITHASAKTAMASTVIDEAHTRLQIPPQYPRRAIALGQEGLVILHVRLDAAGRPQAWHVAQSSGYRLLDTAALAAVRQWVFNPPQSVRPNPSVQVPVEFIIKP